MSYDSYGKCKSCGEEYDMTIKSMSATTYQAVKNDVPVRNRPYSPEKITKYLSKGTKVTVVASGKNSAGNLWYKLKDGSWVYSKNLEKVATPTPTPKPTPTPTPKPPVQNTQVLADGVYTISNDILTYVFDEETKKVVY